MPGAITNTSPLLYLGGIGGLDWLREIFDTVWGPTAVIAELDASGMWISPEIRRRILVLAGEDHGG